jgi:predicted RNase H-like nuclease (RuvC/YqgF family)
MAFSATCQIPRATTTQLVVKLKKVGAYRESLESGQGEKEMGRVQNLSVDEFLPLIRQGAEEEAKKKLLELRRALLTLQEENRALKGEIDQLRDELLDLQSKVCEYEWGLGD